MVVRRLGIGGSPEVLLLRIIFIAKWPIRLNRTGRNGSRLEINWQKFQEIHPFLDHANYGKQTKIVNPEVRKPKKLSRSQQAEKFRKLLASGKVKSRAELARKFGVSRAWVTKVLNDP